MLAPSGEERSFSTVRGGNDRACSTSCTNGSNTPARNGVPACARCKVSRSALVSGNRC